MPFPENLLKGYQGLRPQGAALLAGSGSSSTAGADGAELRQDSEILCSRVPLLVQLLKSREFTPMCPFGVK